MAQRTIGEVYDAVGELRLEVRDSLADHELRIALLENREGRIACLENSDKTQQSEGKAANLGGRMAMLENHTGADRVDLRELQKCLLNVQISQVKLVAVASLVASVVAAAAIIIAAWIK